MRTLIFGQEKKETKNLSNNSLFINDFLVDSKNSPKPGSMIIGHPSNKKQRIELPPEKVLEHVLIIGTNGYGQMTNFVYPNLLNLDNSFVILDQDFSFCPTPPAPLNQKLLVFDCENPLTQRFNWIPLCKDDDLAYSLAKATLVYKWQDSTSFDTQESINLLTAIYSHTASLDKPTPTESYKFICSYGATELVDILLNSASNSAKKIASSLQALESTLLDNYLEKIKVSLEWLKVPNIPLFTESNTSPDFTKLRTEKIGIYLAIQDFNCEISALYRLVLTVLIQQLKSSEGMPVYFFISHRAGIGYLSCLENLSGLTKHKIALIALVHSGLRWQYDYGKEAASKMFNDCYCKIMLERFGLHQSKDFIKKANELIEYNPDGNSYRFNTDFDHMSPRRHLVFLGDHSAIVANTIDGSDIIFNKHKNSTNKAQNSDINLLAKLLCLLLVVLSIISLSCYILFR